MKEIIYSNWNKLDFIKIKNSCSAKDIVKRMRRQATDWEKIFAKDISEKQILSLLKNGQGTSLVVQWLGIWLPMQETRVRSLVQEDLTCHGATKPVHHNC